jgi:hypothetical protein
MAADALVSLGVVIAGVVIIYTDWFWLDAVMSIIIALVILYGNRLPPPLTCGLPTKRKLEIRHYQ